MAVTFLGEDPAGRTATNTRGVRTYQRVFKLSTSAIADDAYAVGSNASLPVIGSVHPSDAGAWCESLQVENSAPWRGWKVTANYTSERELNTNPTSDPAVISWGTEQFQKPVVWDLNGNAVLNSAGDFFDPPNMMDDSRRTVTIQKNLAAVPSWVLDYQDAVNSDAITISGISIAIGKAKMQSVSVAPRESRNGYTFYPTTFSICLQRDGWLLEPLDCGFRWADGADKYLVLNKPENTPVTQPALLDGNGGVLLNPSPANAVFLSYTIYKTRAFSSLPLT